MATHPVLLPGESCGRRSLVGHSPRGGKELDMTERLSTHTHSIFLGKGKGSWFFHQCINLLCSYGPSILMPTCKKKKVLHTVPFITSPNKVVKAMMSPSRCPWRGHRLLDLSGTSAIQVPIKSSLLKGRIEIILVQSLAGGEERRIQILDMSTQEFARMVVSACPSMKLCSVILPPQSPSSVISLRTHYFAPPLDVYCCRTLFCTGFMSIICTYSFSSGRDWMVRHRKTWCIHVC